MKILKILLKYILTFLQIILHKLKGIDHPYNVLVWFFRYFPFGRINLDNTADIKYRNHPVKFYFDNLGPTVAGEFALHDYDRLFSRRLYCD